jgi:hypothetical protein
MFRYRLHAPDGEDFEEATYAQLIKPGEEILLGAATASASSTSSRSRRRRTSFLSSGFYRSRRHKGRSGEPNAPTTLAHSSSGQRRRYSRRVRLPSGRLGHRLAARGGA